MPRISCLLWVFLAFAYSGVLSQVDAYHGETNTVMEPASSGETSVSDDCNNGASTAPGDPQEIVNSLGMRFVRVPEGTFLMGTAPGDERAGEDETQHEVTLSRGFYMGVFEVTQQEYRKLMGGLPKGITGSNRGSNLPVINVSWIDATNFARRLSDVQQESDSQRRYRLPTEAEWEYACRAGSESAYSFGNSDLHIDDYAWFKANSKRRVHEVGQKKPNAFGLYDMHGNVWEWCQDWHGNFSATAVTDPTGPASGRARVLRGGSWNANSQELRCTHRGSPAPELRYGDYGFRLVLE